MIQAGLLPRRVLIQAPGIVDPELLGQVDHGLFRHLAQIGEERPQEPRRAQLHRETQPVRVPPLGTDKPPVGVVEEEEPVQLRARGRPVVAAIPGRLLIGEELNWHAPRTYELGGNP
jgi:hypothetical protein